MKMDKIKMKMKIVFCEDNLCEDKCEDKSIVKMKIVFCEDEDRHKIIEKQRVVLDLL